MGWSIGTDDDDHLDSRSAASFGWILVGAVAHHVEVLNCEVWSGVLIHEQELGIGGDILVDLFVVVPGASVSFVMHLEVDGLAVVGAVGPVP